jgi:hypothetical protein
MKIQHIDIKYVNMIWADIEPFIRSSSEATGLFEYTIDQYKLRLIDGTWTALVAVDEDNKIHGAAVVTFFNRPDSRVGFIVAIGGKLITNKDTFEQLKNFMLLNGATKIEGNARESVARLWVRYGFKEKCRVVGVSI